MTLLLVSLLGMVPVDDSLASEDGTVHLQWSTGAAEAYELEHVFGEERVLTRTGVSDFHLSGLREGEHHYRIRPVGASEWSKPIVVTVGFPNGTLVLSLLLLGTGLFLATATAILRGARSE